MDLLSKKMSEMEDQDIQKTLKGWFQKSYHIKIFLGKQILQK